jgi:biopolymer transport protein ExbD
MRRFSQRNSLVTLNDINITPLLDLAFVLLIIFVITTPLLEQSLELKLPQGGGPNRRIERDDIATAEVSPTGEFVLNGKRMPNFELFSRELRQLRSRRTNLVVSLRAHKDGKYEYPFQIMNLCQQLNVSINLATEPPPNRF